MDTEEKRLKIKHLALNGVMLAIILALQMINMPNIITGIIVNAVFIFVTIYAGTLRSDTTFDIARLRTKLNATKTFLFLISSPLNFPYILIYFYYPNIYTKNL